MKKKFFSLSVFAIALIISSCSRDIDEGQTSDASGGGQAIAFKVWANKQTRAATIASGVTDFAVLATNVATSQVLIDGEVVSGGNGNWSYTPLAFWPDVDEVNFYAYSPTGITDIAPLAASGGGGSTTALAGQDDATAGKPEIVYTLPLAIGGQEDLLVARHTGKYATEGTSGVPLNFRHALSRIKFQARSESAADFKVQSIKLKNIKGKAALKLSGLPKDADVFAYPTNDATLASPGYQTYWVPDGSPVVDLEAKITTADVLGSATGWTDVVGDDDALYVIPQTNAANADYPYSTKLSGPGVGTSGDFYIEITYEDVLSSTVVTYAVPVKAIVGTDPDASSLAFEIERQYTFRFELSGGKPIYFTDVTVSAYNETDAFPIGYTAVADGSWTASTQKIDLVFEEAVDITAADVSFGGTPGAATKGALTKTDDTHYSLAVKATADGTATLSVHKTGVSPDPKNIYVSKAFAEMVPVPGGETQLGSPAQTVTLGDFQIGKYEVTQKQWYDVMGSWPGTSPNIPSATYGVGDDYPMYFVSHDDIQLFLTALNTQTGRNYRLPTEAEWEYAAKGGQLTHNYTYSGSSTVDGVAWYQTNSGSKTHPVGTKAPNELGIYDMSGNVFELCSDWYDAAYPSGTSNPAGPATGTARVERGGSWYDGTNYSLISNRSNIPPNSYYNRVGFRLAL